MDVSISVMVNGVKREVVTDGERPLLEVLREEWGLRGTLFGCGVGECGACSVLVEGARVFSCFDAGVGGGGEENGMTTVEGLAKGEVLHPVQEAFLKEGAYQCGYCTSGMMIAAVALLREKRTPSEAEIREGMDGNLCRCCNGACEDCERRYRRRRRMVEDGYEDACEKRGRSKRSESAGVFESVGDGGVSGGKRAGVGTGDEGRSREGVSRYGRAGGGPVNVGTRLHIGKDGTITVMTGKVEGGQGARAEVTQAVAEELRVSPEKVEVVMGDTSLCPDDGGTFGSQTTPRTLPVVRQAAAGARVMLMAAASAKWGVIAGEVELKEGTGRHAGSGREISYGELVGEDSATVLEARCQRG